MSEGPVSDLAPFPESLVRFALIGAKSAAPIPRAFQHHVLAILDGSFWASYGDALRAEAQRLGPAPSRLRRLFGQRGPHQPIFAEFMWQQAQRRAPKRRGL